MKHIYLLLLFFFISLTSCHKNEELAIEDETTSSEQLQSDDVENEVQNISDAVIVGGPNFRTTAPDAILGTCAQVTIDTIAINHWNIIVDFGTTNCQSVSGKLRRGKILIDLTGNYRDSGSVKVITFDNFYRNDNKIEGTKTIKNIGRNSQNQYQWSIEAQSMKMTKTDGQSHTWNSTRVRTILSGFSTVTISDDEYQITGFANGVNSKGISFLANITQPLHRRMSCNWIDSGQIQFSNSNGQERTINYGTGNCDSEVVIQVTGKRGRTYTKTINLN